MKRPLIYKCYCSARIGHTWRQDENRKKMKLKGTQHVFSVNHTRACSEIMQEVNKMDVTHVKWYVLTRAKGLSSKAFKMI